MKSIAPVVLLSALSWLAPQAAQAQWVTNGSNISYTAGEVGIGIATPYASLTVMSTTAPGALGVLGIGSSVPSSSVGVRGITYSPFGYGGLFDGGQFGLYSQSISPDGNTFGAWAQVTSPNGWGGVFKGGRWGVWGEADGPGRWAGYFVGRGFFSNRVGIGTTEPTAPLHVIGGDMGILGVEVTDSGQVGSPVVAVKGLATGTMYAQGVWGLAQATSGITAGVAGNSYSPDGYGVIGSNLATSGTAYGVEGVTQSPIGTGVLGTAGSSSGANAGVIGKTNSMTDGWGVYSLGNSGCSGLKNFNIDHPLDPANKYLNHFSAEGPEALLIYRGNIVLDDEGAAVVVLPEYFESINRDFTYQLTPVGGPAPALHVASEVTKNRFGIAGGTPGLKVSWCVTGVRNDAYARAYPKAVEEAKPAGQVGKFLHPQLYGAPESAGIFAQRASPFPQQAPVSADATNQGQAYELPVPAVPQAAALRGRP